MVTKLQFVRAIDQFNAVLESEPELAREAHLGLGVSFLNRQPKTRGTIDTARQHFNTVIRGDADDELGIRARYLLGRLEQLHRYEPDWNLAKTIYEDLFTEHTEHLYAQLAKVRWITLHLFAVSPHEEKRALLEDAKALEEGITHPVARRDYHTLMAGIYDHFGFTEEEDLQRVLYHLQQANEAGIVKPGSRANIFVRIAETARLVGKYDLAAEFYDQFLAEFRRDNRHGWVEERRQEIEPQLTTDEEPGKDS